MSLQRKRLLRWYCVNTHPLQENQVQKQLKALDFQNELFLLHDGKKERPVFPGYVFVKFNYEADPWRAIWRLHGVKRLFSASAQCPTVMPGRLLDIVRAELRKLSPDSAPDPASATILEGDEVQLVRGPFRQFVGICQLSANDRVSILLNVLGTPSVFKVDRADVQLVRKAS